MTLWTTIQTGDSDKTPDRGSSTDSYGRREIRSAATPRVLAVASEPTILLISSSVLEREALSLILERGGFVVHSAEPDIATITTMSPPIPTVVLVEVPNGPEASHRDWFNNLRHVFPRSQLVLLAETLNPDWLVLCRDAGLSGYLTKASATLVIHRQLRLIASGERILPVAMLREIARIDTRMERVERPRIETLTRRDVEILQHLVAGHSNKVIAGRLQLAESTVKVAMKSVFVKIGASNRTQAAVWALNHGFDKSTEPSELVRAPAGNGNFK